MRIKIITAFFLFFVVLVSCKDEVIKKPNPFIEKEKMVDIMYDLTLLTAIKSKGENPIDSLPINSNQYIYKKYKIDSTQFAQNNIYYAADHVEYQKIIEQIKVRLEKEIATTNALIKTQAKKDALRKAKEEKLKAKKVKDSIAKVKKLKLAKEKDSITKVKKQLKITLDKKATKTTKN